AAVPDPVGAAARGHGPGAGGAPGDRRGHRTRDGHRRGLEPAAPAADRRRRRDLPGLAGRRAGPLRPPPPRPPPRSGRDLRGGCLGPYLGSRVAGRVPSGLIRRGITIVLAVTAAAMLGAPPALVGALALVLVALGPLVWRGLVGRYSAHLSRPRPDAHAHQGGNHGQRVHRPAAPRRPRRRPRPAAGRTAGVRP